jgi:hypothetical protein
MNGFMVEKIGLSRPRLHSVPEPRSKLRAAVTKR